MSNKKISRPKIVLKIKTIINENMSNLDKIMLIKCLIDTNFELRDSDSHKFFQPETLDCF